MTLQQILFLIFSAITLIAALMVVTRRNLCHAALFMVLSFFGVAGLYVLLEAPFLAGVQVFIYVGGISTLIIFAIVLTRDVVDPTLPPHNRQWIAGALVMALLCSVLIWTVLGYQWTTTTPGQVPADSIARLGTILVDPEGFLLPFEVTSVLLFAVLIGAITIARER
ncbi:MAG TPA: NADH-quinone oxidoreductase subunit J [Chloroflexi bacterium]|nr:NADH-quinone oxidoreductase subunit J [Chloroflexota bacterium]